MAREPALVWGPTYEEMLHPFLIDEKLKKEAIEARSSDPLNFLNLYNISWRDADNLPYYTVIPRELAPVDATVVALYGSRFPTGSHKVGATYSVIMESQIKGEIHPGASKVVFPSTGNYGIGGAFVGSCMGYETLVVLP
jgi:cysteine synthase A